MIVACASLAVCAAVGVGCSFDTSTRLAQAVEDAALVPQPPDSSVVETCGGDTWWNPGFSMRRSLALDPAPYAYTMQLILDATTVPTAQELVDRSLVAGAQDLRVVRRNGSTWEEIDRQVLAFDSNRVEIRFRIQEADGFAGGGAQYYLYYGNSGAGPALADRSKVYRHWHDFEGDAIGSDGSPALNSLPAGEWRVEDDSGNHVYRANGVSRLTAELVGVTAQNAVFEARMRVVAPDFGSANHDGLALRVDNFIPAELDAYIAQLRGSEQVSAIVTYRTGSFITTGVVSAAPIQVQQWYQLRAELSESTIDFYVDGLLVVTMNNAELLRTGLGLFAFDGDAVFDDLSVRDRLPAEPVVAVEAEQEFCP